MTNRAGAVPSAEKVQGDWYRLLDVVAKLLAASAVVAGAFIANQFQAELTATRLLAEREQAESDLRARMFSDLIGPIVGPEDTGLAVDEELLLVELLALNFHEHFEFKPLLAHVEDRILAEKEGTDLERARDSLHSMVRRVTARQIAFLVHQSGSDEKRGHVEVLYLAPSREGGATSPDGLPSEGEVASPDGTSSVKVTLLEVDWERETVEILLTIDTEGRNLTPLEFELGFYDLPLTDNTRLGDSNRFAIVLESLDEEANEVFLNVVWFPREYVGLSERPLNLYQEVRR